MIKSKRKTIRMTAPPRLLEAFTHLNRIGSAINQLDPDDLASIQTVLRMIVNSATEVVPGSSACCTPTMSGKASLITSREFRLEKRRSPGWMIHPAPMALAPGP